jgi:hypothetical protein
VTRVEATTRLGLRENPILDSSFGQFESWPLWRRETRQPVAVSVELE